VRVYLFPSDLAGCGYYRLIWPGLELKRRGHDVRLVHPNHQQKITGGKDAQGRLVQVSLPNDADVMVFQRVSSATIVDAIKIMRQHGIAVVVDVDDDMHAIHAANPAFGVLNPNAKGPDGKLAEYNWEYAKRACEAASFVTVSTPALLPRYAPHGRGVVLYNCVPEVYLKIAHTEEAPHAIGWGGSLHSHPDDPMVCGPAMGRLQRAGYHFKIVGPPRGTREAFQLDDEPVATGPVPIGAYAHELAKLAVGIAPLSDTRFNGAKSWLKMLEYAAVGVPCIGSPRNEYRRLHARGVGLLADSPRDWHRLGRALMDDEERRTELSAIGREVCAELTIEGNAWRWAEAWSHALEIERGPLGIKRPSQAVATVPDPT
jgi:glycosyltransferase involved in cell wall biosynthesis